MIKRLAISIGAIVLNCGFYSGTAIAACSIPHALSNGQVADATQVMDDFHAVADCADASVSPTGTPSTGEIAVFSGGQTVTGGDLSGDITTSGSTATSLAATGVTPGTYIFSTITVDAKGRITSAANGTGGGGGGGSSSWTELTLTNPGAETGDTTGWTMVGGGFTSTTANPSGHVMTPIFGTYAFTASANASPKMYQVVDLSTFATAIDAGTVEAKLGAYAADTYTTGEAPYVYIEFHDASNALISIVITAAPPRSMGQGVWRYLEVSAPVPPLARSMNLYLWASRADGTNNNVAFDGIRAFVRGF
jgi:hypothetical protein